VILPTNPGNKGNSAGLIQLKGDKKRVVHGGIKKLFSNRVEGGEAAESKSARSIRGKGCGGGLS